MIALPPWVDPELWAEYVAQRIKDRKAMSPRSERDRIVRLQAIKDAGHDPNAAIAEAINGHWLEFYAPRDKSIERRAGYDPETEIRRQEQRQRDAALESRTPEQVAASKSILERARAAIRRVA